MPIYGETIAVSDDDSTFRFDVQVENSESLTFAHAVHVRGLFSCSLAATRYEAPSEEDAHNWVKGVLAIDHADGTTWHDIPKWTQRRNRRPGNGIGFLLYFRGSKRPTTTRTETKS